jgi:hypothetical protein
MPERDYEKAVKRLMTWCTKDEGWNERLGAALDMATLAAAQDAGLTDEAIEKLWASIDPVDGQVLMAFATEDFFTQAHGPAGATLIDSYLTSQGWKENAATKGYLLALRDALAGVYRVESVKQDDHWVLVDLLNPGAPIVVDDAFAPDEVDPGTIIAAHLIHHDGNTVMSEGMLQMPPELAEPMRLALEEQAKEVESVLAEVAEERGFGLTDSTRKHLAAEGRGLLACGAFVQMLATELGLLPEDDGEDVED